MNNKEQIWPPVCPITSFLELVDTTRIDQPVELEMNESKKNYLHPIAGSDAAMLARGCLRSQWFDTRREDFMMRTIRTGTVGYAAAIAALSFSSLQAQTVQASLAKEAGTLSDKFTGLARVMAGKLDWKPGEGVRSAGEVFNLIVAENDLLARTLAGAAGGGRPAPITDPEKLQEALKTSYVNLQQAIAGLSDADLKAPVKVFGKDFTKEESIRYIFGDQHEHLGQSIAYARSNGVVPPWSK
jgi:uncharacterized damage-inducible protein DinB